MSTDVEPVTELVHFPNVEALMEGRDGGRVSDEELVELFFRHGRSLILAPPGAGKSTLLDRLTMAQSTRIAATHSLPAVLATLRQLPHRNSFRRWLTDSTRRPPGTKMLLCLDGLDEVPLGVAQDVLDHIEDLSRKDPQLAVVVADRVTRRAVQSDRWAHFGIAARGGQPLLTWADLPFFRQRNPGVTSRSEAILQLGVDASASVVTPEELADGAYEWLKEADTAAVSAKAAARLLGESVLARLRTTDLIVERDETTQFSHPLFLAYFAAQHVSVRTELWGDASWDALTLGGANFTALGLLLELVGEGEVERLVRSVDRWNYLASGSLLVEDFAGPNRISSELRRALLLLLGHRTFSPNVTTSVLSRDQLRLQIGDSLARRILDASDRRELGEIAESLPEHGAWWRAWLSTFLNQDHAGNVDALCSDDDLLAWTAANVLSATRLSASVEDALLALLSGSTDDHVRWRVIHALSASHSTAVADRCFEIFLDGGDEWVRYGALRVLLQVTAQLDSPEDRARICISLSESVDLIRGTPRWEREIERAVQLDDAPPDWPSTYGRVIAALWARATGLYEEDRWRSAASVLRIDDDDPFAAALRPMPEKDGA